MRFTFDEDQRLFQSTVREFLSKEYPPEAVRARWEDSGPGDRELWSKLAALGIPGLLVPEASGGLGLTEIDSVLVFEEAGRAALAEPVVATAAVAAPLLAALEGSELGARWLERIARGDAIVAVGHEASPFVSDADRADLLLLPQGDAVHALEPDRVEWTREPTDDPSRRLFSVRFRGDPKTRVAEGERGRALWTDALDRGALACAAEQIGVAERLIEMSVGYAQERRQFGVPIGSFQAVKHMLANAKVRLEYARPAVYRAAHSVARRVSQQSLHVSMAKAGASDAAALAAQTALQVHGAIGYTWEQDLHIWMRRAWSLALAWGSSATHRARVEETILADGARLGPGETFRGG